MKRVICYLLLACACWHNAPHGRAAKNDWAEGQPGRSTGASRDYYNSAGQLAWRNFMGDWHDVEGVAQGDAAYATMTVKDEDRARFIEWDVTRLVREWVEGRHQNKGLFLRTAGKGGIIVFRSREHESENQRPSLHVTGTRGEKILAPLADAHLDTSTYRSLGDRDELRVSGRPNNLLVRFDINAVRGLLPVSRVVLRLFTTKQYGDAEIGVFRCSQGHDLPPSPPTAGLAARYPCDNGITKDPQVIFATGFEADTWAEEWTYAGKMDVIDTVSEDGPRAFEPLHGKALRVSIKQGANSALNTLFKFGKETGREPEEIYFRYYLRLGSDWNQTIEGGKMPGISGTYGVAGWGGRKSDGTDGWSARGSFGRSIPDGNPLGGLHPIGTYCYHADMKGRYGDSWGWHRDYRGFLEKNRWYSIEQYLKLNTVGRADGVLRAWVDGRIAFEKTDIRFRRVDRLKIEQIWMNVYHGGKRPSPHDQHLFIDNVVIATKYIGPMKR
jgi:hypothetical protein